MECRHGLMDWTLLGRRIARAAAMASAVHLDERASAGTENLVVVPDGATDEPRPEVHPGTLKLDRLEAGPTPR